MKILQHVILMASTLLLLLVACNSNGAWVVMKDGRIYIEDRNGERWDVTQAKELGFTPQRFQYGIGRNAFTPLDDGDFSDNRPSPFSNTRVIGVSNAGDAHAYSVERLRHHEIANTTVGGHPIAAGY